VITVTRNDERAAPARSWRIAPIRRRAATAGIRGGDRLPHDAAGIVEDRKGWLSVSRAAATVVPYPDKCRSAGAAPGFW
jgi:hypothetical protein